MKETVCSHQPEGAMNLSLSSHSMRGRRPRRAPYATRLLAALAAVLLLMLLLVHLPVQRVLPAVGWGVQAPHARIALHELAQEDASSRPIHPEAAPVVAADRPPPGAQEEAAQTTAPQAAAAQQRDSASSATASSDVYPLSALGPSADRPRIEGGPGRLFLRIDYPAEARRKGIEGRVVLNFVVDTEGRTRDIAVHQSLHPLCDSSAVRALRDTRFVPGRRLDEPVNVRMRLPVRFRLVGQPDPALASDSVPDSSS